MLKYITHFYDFSGNRSRDIVFVVSTTEDSVGTTLATSTFICTHISFIITNRIFIETK